MIENGNKVKVEYVGTLDDGSVFDSSQMHGQPLTVEVGAHQVIPAFEEALVGMKVGEEKKIHVKNAYGDHKDELLKSVPRDSVPQESKEGMMLSMKLQNGVTLPVKVLEVGDKEVKLDLNHPLAGKDLNFELKIVEIVE